METRYCKKCNDNKILTEEFWHKRKDRKDGWEFYCKTCINKTTRENYYKQKSKWRATHNKNSLIKKEKLIEIKQKLKCQKCDENRYYLLDFHHLDPSQKEFQISQGSEKGWDKIFKEMAKCIVLCSNCHREFHHLQKQNDMIISQYLEK